MAGATWLRPKPKRRVDAQQSLRALLGAPQQFGQLVDFIENAARMLQKYSSPSGVSIIRRVVRLTSATPARRLHLLSDAC